MASNCPLCKSPEIHFQFHQKLHSRDFYLCETCDLSFVDRDKLLDRDEEKSRYDLHQNDIRSTGYEKFLRRVINPVISSFSSSAKGLDFGSGPYPMLIEIFNEEGFQHIEGYDPLYRPDSTVFEKKYAFITMCEVIEHIYDLNFEVSRIAELLDPESWLVISTGIKQASAELEKWHYIHDDTHINLFSTKTFEWMERSLGLKIEKLEQSLVIFSKI